MAIRDFDELVERQREHACPGIGNQRVCVRVVATARHPTRFGDYHVVAFENRLDAKVGAESDVA
jgi:GTP cyclohydrolase II